MFKLVTLLDPEMCVNCVFNKGRIKVKDVLELNGTFSTIHCTRADCDNHVSEGTVILKDDMVIREDSTL